MRQVFNSTTRCFTMRRGFQQIPKRFVSSIPQSKLYTYEAEMGLRNQNISEKLPFREIGSPNYETEIPQILQTNPPIKQKPETMIDISQILVALSELESRHGIKIKSFPFVVTIGNQSSGKTSFIESICGESVFPKAMKMATMKPIYLTTVRSKDKKFRIGDMEFTNPEEAAIEIDRLNNNSSVKKIHVTIWSPNVYNSNLIDLPGLFSVATNDQPGLPKEVKKLVIQYLEDPNNIPVVIHAGPIDPQTDNAIKLIHTTGRADDAFGIITKVDMLANENMEFIKDMLNGKSVPLKHGWCAVILRNDNDIKTGMTIAEKNVLANKFFATRSLFPCGVEQAQQLLSKFQYYKIKDQMPSILDEIDIMIANLKLSQTFMQNISSNDNKKRAARLRSMIEKLVGSSLDRAEYEDGFKHQLQEVITKYMEETFFKRDRVRTPQFSSEVVDKKIMYLNSTHKTKPSDFKIDGIKELFSFGLVSPTFIDNNTIKKSYDNEIKLSLGTQMIDVYIDDPQARKRSHWYKYLNNYFTKLMENNNIHKIVCDITEKSLLEYICNDSEGYDEITKKFAEYMIKEIHKQSNETIGDINMAIINLERRPQIFLSEIFRHFCQMYPSVFTFDGKMFELVSHENRKIKLEVYGEDWNEAYLKVVTEKIIENCYRNVAVNLLDRMVEKLIEMTIDLSNEENAAREQNKLNDKLNHLVEVRNKISTCVFNNADE